MKRLLDFILELFLFKSHECDFDYDNPEYDTGRKHYCCKHKGCNMITSINLDGTDINETINAKQGNNN